MKRITTNGDWATVAEGPVFKAIVDMHPESILVVGDDGNKRPWPLRGVVDVPMRQVVPVYFNSHAPPVAIVRTFDLAPSAANKTPSQGI